MKHFHQQNLLLLICALAWCAGLRAQDELARLIKSNGLAQTIAQLEQALAKNPADDLARARLKMIIAGNHGVTREESLRLRQIVRTHTHRATEVLIPPEEPGEPLIVSGTVRSKEGKPIAGALIYVFQADAKGNYTFAHAMDEQNARLFGYMKSGADGRYEFRTIRPGGYAQAPIPQHIHMLVSAPGYREHKCQSTCQLVFADDPRVTAEWREWAGKSGNPILRVTRGTDGAQSCVYDVILEKQ